MIQYWKNYLNNNNYYLPKKSEIPANNRYFYLTIIQKKILVSYLNKVKKKINKYLKRVTLNKRNSKIFLKNILLNKWNFGWSKNQKIKNNYLSKIYEWQMWS